MPLYSNESRDDDWQIIIIQSLEDVAEINLTFSWIGEGAQSLQLPYFPVYKRPFFVHNFHFKNKGSLIHGSKSFSASMYCSSENFT